MGEVGGSFAAEYDETGHRAQGAVTGHAGRASLASRAGRASLLQ